MDVQAFRREVQWRAPSRVSRPILEVALEACVGMGWCERRHVAACIQLAGVLEASGLAPSDEPAGGDAVHSTPVGRPTPEMRLRSAQLRRRVDASVAAMRTALFGQASPPFPSLAEGIAWLEREVQRLYQDVGESARQVYQPLWDQALSPSSEAGHPGTPETSRRLMALLDGVRAGMVVWVAPAAGVPAQGARALLADPLFGFQRQVHRIARATGFAAPDVLAYVLAGTEPVLPPATQAVEHVRELLPYGGGEIQRSQVTVVVQARDLSYRDHRALFRQVRQALNLVRVKGLSEADVRLLELVEQCGPPPSGRGSGPYWTRVQRAWNGQGLGPHYEGPDGPRMRYRRLQPKLAALGLTASLGTTSTAPSVTRRRARPR